MSHPSGGCTSSHVSLLIIDYNSLSVALFHLPFSQSCRQSFMLAVSTFGGGNDHVSSLSIECDEEACISEFGAIITEKCRGVSLLSFPMIMRHHLKG